jgi:drug/metabolite transporter (DMT)-like permease
MPVDWAILALLVVVWGSAYALTSIAVQDFPPQVLVAIRLWIGVAVLGAACIAVGAKLPRLDDRTGWGVLVVIGVGGTLAPFLLISLAQTEVPSALAAIMIAGAPICTAMLSHLFVPGERLNRWRIAGVAAGFAGIAILFAPGLTGSGGASLGHLAMLLAAAFCYSAAGIMVRLTQPNLHPLAMSAGFVLTSAVAAVPLAWAALPAGGLAVSPGAWAAAAGLGVGSTALGSLLYVVVIRRVGPVFMSSAGNLVPFWSLLLGVVFMGEALPATVFAGLAVIVLGLWLVQRRAG